jgi:hypothetical protein
MEVSGQLHALATLPPRKDPLVPIGEEAGWALEPVWENIKTNFYETFAYLINGNTRYDNFYE